jgi:hypothetical protein
MSEKSWNVMKNLIIRYCHIFHYRVIPLNDILKLNLACIWKFSKSSYEKVENDTKENHQTDPSSSLENEHNANSSSRESSGVFHKNYWQILCPITTKQFFSSDTKLELIITIAERHYAAYKLARVLSHLVTKRHGIDPFKNCIEIQQHTQID